MMAWLRSVLHMAFMVVTLVPSALLIVVASLCGVRADALYVWDARWLRSVQASRTCASIMMSTARPRAQSM